MNRVRIVIVVPEMTDEEALKLKKAVEELVKFESGATVEMNLRPPRVPTRR